MGLRLKFNLVLALVFLLGLGVSGYVSYDLLHKNARDEVLRNAGVMLEAALSMRAYTVGHVRPKLRVVEDEFLPESVPAFAATEIMSQLRKKYPDYAYKEAALNPTNPRNRTVEWESDIVNEFRNNEGRKELSGTRMTPSGMSMYLARPFQIKDPACLACHTTPEMAPPALVKLYGTGNGFGWKLNEVIGAQIVSVPMSLPIENANRAFYTFMTSLAVGVRGAVHHPEPDAVAADRAADHAACRRPPTRSASATWTFPSSPKRARTRWRCWRNRSTACAAAWRRRIRLIDEK